VPLSGAAVEVTPETQVHRALSVNVRRYTAFSGTWEPVS
jgi:alpha-galactosidase